MVAAVFLIKAIPAGFNGDLAQAGDGILGIDTEIDKDLIDLGGLGHRNCMNAKNKKKIPLTPLNVS